MSATRRLFGSALKLKPTFQSSNRLCIQCNHRWPSAMSLSRRWIRVIALTAEQEINMIPHSVPFRNIDPKGGTRRFYRQVHIQSFANPNAAPDEKPGWCLYLDHRMLITNGSPIVLDSYELALMVGTELESQSEYMRCESMPLTEMVVTLLEKQTPFKSIPPELQRRGYRGSVISHFEHDLLRIAESPELKKEGFYDEIWMPIIDWFNGVFKTKVKLEYMSMEGESDDVETIRQNTDPTKIYDKDPDDLLVNYKRTEIAQKVDYLQTDRKIDPNTGLIKRFLKDIDNTRLWVMDDLIQYCYSPILAFAVVLNAVPLEHLLKAIQCPELDTQMIVRNEEHLKMNETMMRLAAAKSFMNAYDRVHPLPKNEVINTYPNAIVQTYAKDPK